MRTFTIQFPNLQLMWSFAKNLKVHVFRINTKEMQLTCQCEEKLIEEAFTFYKARLVTNIIEAVL